MNKIEKLKTKLKEHKLDGYLIPIRDEWGCEYVPARNQRLQFITGFTGSNGFAVICKENSAFFTDGRYTLQAKLQVNKNDFSIFDLSDTTPAEWISENFKSKTKIGYDAALLSISDARNLKEKLEKKNIKLVEIENNLIDDIWEKRPSSTETKPFILDKNLSGKKASEKIKWATKQISGDVLLLTSSESICWLLNLRANDLPYTPVLFSYAIINKKEEVFLYSNLKSLTKIEDKIDGDVFIRNANEIYKDLKKYSGKTIELDSSLTSVKFKNILTNLNCTILEKEDTCLKGRSIKNDSEIEATKTAHIRDGAALCKFLSWLNRSVNNNKLTEISIAEKLEVFRKENKNFYSLSFDTIAGWNKNGAVIHYRADERSNSEIKGTGILLLDSGAQYLDGTTDVTRTISFGAPTKEQKRNFTLVLKGHIALAKQKFLKGTSGANLDILARKFLWSEGLDYKHGTGHGVGFFLNVHEGPHAINKVNRTPLEPGMIISNEPGYYKEKEYGIRIENLVLVKKSKEKGFYEFETLTKAPIDKNLIDKTLLEQNEIDWLNNYHNDVYNKVAPLLSETEKAWLKKATSKI